MSADMDPRALLKRRLAQSRAAAAEQARIINENPAPTLPFLHEHLKAYVLAKYMLPADCAEDNIKALANLSLQATLKVDKNSVHELDTAAPCNHATSESTKKVLLLYAVQHDLRLPECPSRLAAVSSVAELARYVLDMRAGAARDTGPV